MGRCATKTPRIPISDRREFWLVDLFELEMVPISAYMKDGFCEMLVHFPLTSIEIMPTLVD